MNYTANLGYPRIGLHRELKFALEKFWQSKIPIETLEQTAQEIQLHNWKLQRDLEVHIIPSNDFSYYDHVLDTAVMVGAIPQRFREDRLGDATQRYFAMARGFQDRQGTMIAALEMTKWFNTNYHYLVPEISKNTVFQLDPQKPTSAFKLASQLGILTRPVILGPVSFLLLSKSPHTDFSPLEKLADLLPVYQQLLGSLHTLGAEWVQLDEPFLVCDLTDQAKQAYCEFFHAFREFHNRPQVMLTPYFDDISQNMEVIQDSPFEGLHLDLTCFELNVEAVQKLPKLNTLSLGAIDGRNIWRADLDAIGRAIVPVMPHLPVEHVLLTPSCSLLHVPQDVGLEDQLDEQKKSWLAFARQKLQELTLLKKYLDAGGKADAVHQAHQKSVAERARYLKSNTLRPPSGAQGEGFQSSAYRRHSDYAERKVLQSKKLNLPFLPTTTIGSFPQTAEVRQARSKFTRGELEPKEYEAFLKREMAHAIQVQEDAGLDVLVHGEFERNDMVQYFGEKLQGFMFTQHGWVQSFGSRYVRPPIIFGPVSRPHPITTYWAEYAQSLTEKPVKGMLTGPVTILQWSFVRDDQPRAQTCAEIAHALREEVLDLEKLGISIIQIDEPALREGLPLHRADWEDYLQWAVACFRIASSGVKDETQIHTHMCYAEFNDIMPSISEMDADVISIEASRSGMELLNAFRHYDYPNEIGPGVYDIHSPNIPSKEQIINLLEKALEVIPADKLWVNPDCGLKTRKWEEVVPSLRGMVAAARQLREKVNG